MVSNLSRGTVIRFLLLMLIFKIQRTFHTSKIRLADDREFMYIGGWGAELNREIVSCRACVRAVCMSSEFGAKKCGPGLSLFPFGLGRFSLFPSPAPQSPIQLQLALSEYDIMEMVFCLTFSRNSFPENLETSKTVALVSSVAAIPNPGAGIFLLLGLVAKRPVLNFARRRWVEHPRKRCHATQQ